MALPGPFLSGQRLTAGQLNDATQKTLASVDVNKSPGNISGTVTNVETTITDLTLGPFDQVTGALYQVHARTILEQNDNTSEFFLIMRKNTPLTGTIIASWDVWRPPFTGAAFLFTGWADFPATVNEAVTYYFSLVRFSGTGGMVMYGHHPNDSRSITPTGVKIMRSGYASEHVVVT